MSSKQKIYVKEDKLKNVLGVFFIEKSLMHPTINVGMIDMVIGSIETVLANI